MRAHRLAWRLTRGVDAGELCVLHRCDNPPCCNPRHLFLGTQATNMADMRRKARAVGHRKLTAELVREIRQRCAAGEAKKALARAFGVSPTTVRDAVARRSWAEVD